MTEIRRADPAARRQALIIVVVGAVTGASLLLALEVYQDPLLDWVRSQPRERMTVVFSLVAAMLSAPVFALAVYLWLLAAKIVKTEVFPPSGLRLIRDTTRITGSTALLRGRMLKGIAVCLAIVSGLSCLAFWWLVRVLNDSAA
jgi:hypothetical protein